MSRSMHAHALGGKAAVFVGGGVEGGHIACTHTLTPGG